jgi:ribonuclease HII
MDEVGRGAIAGAVAVGVVAVLPDMPPAPAGLRDSKMLSEKKRDILAPQAAEWAAAYAVGSATATEIEQIGITKALALAGMRALASVYEQLVAKDLPTDGYLILDGSHNWLGTMTPFPGLKVTTRVKADRDDMVVAAASVIAKVERDAVMIDLAKDHPYYGWESNKGYGAAIHYEGIASHGQVDGVHRSSWIK